MPEVATTIDEYIGRFPEEVQEILTSIRELVHDVAPDATEAISYQIPAFKLDGKILVYFAGWKDHVSMYPLPQGDTAFDTELKKYQSGKGTARFALDEPLPEAFVRRLLELHVNRIR